MNIDRAASGDDPLALHLGQPQLGEGDSPIKHGGILRRGGTLTQSKGEERKQQTTKKKKQYTRFRE
jgi:hypothetical protein